MMVYSEKLLDLTNYTLIGIEMFDNDTPSLFFDYFLNFTFYNTSEDWIADIASREEQK